MRRRNRTSLCYHCTVLETGKSCFKDSSDSPKIEKDYEAELGFLDRIKKPIYSTYVRAMQMKTLVSTSFTDILNNFRSDNNESEHDLYSDMKSHFNYADFPENVFICRRCLCYFSSSVVCHCKSCSGGSLSHYVILMHGVLVSPLMMADCCKALLYNYPNLFIYFPVSVSGKTLHGTIYVLKLLINELYSLFYKLPNEFKLSMIGHSYGGILLRYFIVHYHMTTEGLGTGSEFKGGFFNKDLKSENNKDIKTDINQRIILKNLICIATPHAGVHENNLDLRRLMHLMGSKTVAELENETVDLLFLLKEGGFLHKFENVVLYGNISGDIMVPPRTSVILPRYIYSDKDLSEIQQILQSGPEGPVDISCQYIKTLLRQFHAEDGPEPDRPQLRSESDNKLLFNEFVSKFYDLVNLKIKNTEDFDFIQHLNYLYKNLNSYNSTKLNKNDKDDDKNYKSNIKKSFLKLPKSLNMPKGGIFGDNDILRFNESIFEIISNSDSNLINSFRESDPLFYNEVILSILYKIKSLKFAVYIPRILIPHRSIISFQSPVVHEYYTELVLSHIVKSFVM